jgi:hypothetical protein
LKDLNLQKKAIVSSLVKLTDVITMSEISKQYRVILFINMTVGLIYGVLFGFLWWWWAGIIEWDIGSTPFYGQVVGGLFLIYAIWNLRAVLQRKEWGAISYFMEFTFVLNFVMLIYFGWEFLFIKPTGMALINSIVAVGVAGVLFILNLIFYFVESAKHK